VSLGGGGGGTGCREERREEKEGGELEFSLLQTSRWDLSTRKRGQKTEQNPSSPVMPFRRPLKSNLKRKKKWSSSSFEGHSLLSFRPQRRRRFLFPPSLLSSTSSTSHHVLFYHTSRLCGSDRLSSLHRP